MNTNTGPSIKPSRAVSAALALILGLSAAQAQDAGASKHYVLPATPENVQWGWYDINEKPKVTIKSGDTVSIETLSHSLGKIKPGVDMDEIVKLRKGNPGGGPHSITRTDLCPGREPGDTLEIHILKSSPKLDAFNFNVPGKDSPRWANWRPSSRKDSFATTNWDLEKMQTQFKPGIVIDLKPFPGTFAVGVDPNEPDAKAGPPIKDAKGRTSTLRPWKTAPTWT